jgi:acetoacetyl-[acyl-carrier protein] synthase
MLHLPLIVAAGGVNSAGRSSGHHAYRRMVIDALPMQLQVETRAALAAMMGSHDVDFQDQHTLIRAIEAQYFDPRRLPWNRRVQLRSDQGARFTAVVGSQEEGFDPEWRIERLDKRQIQVDVPRGAEVLLPATRDFEVSVAGQLPTGFDPGSLYPSRNHPRGLQMSIFAASDALADLGIDWEVVQQRVPADAIGVYMSSAMGQLDHEGTGGMLRARSNGKRVTSKQCPLGFAEMPGDFLNAYLLHSAGVNGPALGACATFLYNLRLAANDIRSGRTRVAVVGAVEAAINPETMDGYAAMGALATDKGLRELDGLGIDQLPDFRRACRPFGNNCGFTMGESAQVVVLFDDALTLELGAHIHAAVPDVFVSADGAKKSITGPGAGNYVTVGKALSALRNILGEARLRTGGLVQAHGTGTPQNRVTESTILNRMAGAFGIDRWAVSAIKSYVGHSLGAAAGDQLTATLGIWAHGVMPGITTIDALAEDVQRDHLKFSLANEDFSARDYAVINSKGFGGNNASAAILGPEVTQSLLASAHGSKAMTNWQSRCEEVKTARTACEGDRLAGRWSPRYRFDDGVLTDSDIDVSDAQLSLGRSIIDLTVDTPKAWRMNDK